MGFGDWFIAMLVIVIVGLLSYASIRHKDLMDIVREIRDIIQGKYGEVKEAGGELKYANAN